MSNLFQDVMDEAQKKVEPFTDKHLETLRTEYGKIKTINPDSDTYKKLTKHLDSLHPTHLKQLHGANIPFVSSLARNRINKGLSESIVDLDRATLEELDEAAKPSLVSKDAIMAYQAKHKTTWDQAKSHLEGEANAALKAAKKALQAATPRAPRPAKEKMMTRTEFLKIVKGARKDFKGDNPDVDMDGVAWDLADSLLWNSDLKAFVMKQVGSNKDTMREYIADYLSEEVETLDEISKGTLGSYIKKATMDIGAAGAGTREYANRSHAASKRQDYNQAKKDNAQSDKIFAKGWKRKMGVAKAVDRLTKEDLDTDTKTAIATAVANEAVNEGHGYVAFYKGRRMEVQASTSYEAQKKAAAAFKAKKSYEVTVKLAEKDGKPVVHVATESFKPTGIHFNEECDEMVEQFKVGDVVKPTKGVHKGQPHHVIHDHGDGRYNIKPIMKHGAAGRRGSLYRQGAATAHKDDLIKESAADLEEGWSADTHNTKVVSHNREWHGVERKYSDHEGMSKTLKDLRSKNWKATSAEAHALKKHSDVGGVKESEQIDELSNKKLIDYYNKAAGDTKDRSVGMKKAFDKTLSNNKNKWKKFLKIEETEPIEELNKETLSSYKDKAGKVVKEVKPWTKKGEYKDIAKRIVAKRETGIAKADKKLGEDIDQDDFVFEAVHPLDAKKILAPHAGKDFHELSSSAVDDLLTHAKKHKFRKSATSSGSTGRAFHAHLVKQAAKAPKNEDVEILEVKVGDKVHVGISQKGGAGYTGTVEKVEGDKVHVKGHEATRFGNRTFVGHKNNVTVENEEWDVDGILVESTDEDFNKKLDSHLKGCHKIHDEYRTRMGFTKVDPPKFTAQHGKKYVKIVRSDGGSRSVHSFIDKATGDVLKPASWNAPAKHARGNLHDEHNGLKHMGPHGPAYLK